MFKMILLATIWRPGELWEPGEGPDRRYCNNQGKMMVVAAQGMRSIHSVDRERGGRICCTQIAKHNARVRR